MIANNQSPTFKATYGDKSYFLTIMLYNSEGDALLLVRDSMKFLEIVDNIFNPFHEGTLVITNDFNIIESGEMAYTFLGNGRDYLAITISTENTDDEFTMAFTMVVTECVDIKYQNSICKQLTFCEERQYLLNEKFCDILEIKKNTAGASSYLETNAGNSQTTGELIKKILDATFDDQTDLYTSTYDEEGCVSLNLSPYGVMPYSQLLSYVMMSHSHQKSPCFLDHDRQSKKFTLMSFKRLFESHDQLVVERLIFPDPLKKASSQENRSYPNIKFTPTNKVFGTNAAGNDSTIMEFFTESPAAMHGVNFFASQSISSMSRNFSTFTYNLKALNKDEYTKTYYEMFVEPFKSLFEKEQDKHQLLPNFYVSKVKQKKNWTQIDGALPAAITEQQFLNQKMFSLLFLNQTYIFKLPGITRRRCGTFVDVYKETLNVDEMPSNWDVNTLGRHLITCVKHIFTHDTYNNHVETIKPYRLFNASQGASDLNTMLNTYQI